jgi:TctA family transporter
MQVPSPIPDDFRGLMMEEYLRLVLTISHSSPTVFFTCPLSLTPLVIALLFLVATMVPSITKQRKKTFG